MQGALLPGHLPRVSVASGCWRLTAAAGGFFSPCSSAWQPLHDKSSSQQRCEGASLVLVLLLSFFLNPSFFFSLLSHGSSPVQKVVSPAVPLTRALPISLAVDEYSRASSVYHHLCVPVLCGAG